MKVITFEDIISLSISPPDCYRWVCDMLQAKEGVILPAKISLKPREGVLCNVMPCILNNGYGGVKIVTRYPQREPSLDSKLFLFDVQTGKPLALMDANWITAMRTGAVAAHSILLLAKTGFSHLSMLGLGNTARAALLVLAEMMPQKEMQINLMKYKGQEDLFVQRFASYPNLHFSYVDNERELIHGAEVVISAATYLPHDLCDDAYFDEGVLVVPIHTLGFTNCDLFFDKIYADDYGHVSHFKNFDRFKQFSEVSAVIHGKAKGRENDQERIMVYNIGLAMHDVYFASQIYERIEKENLQQIDMREPHEKFWL